ncbi:DnaJ domain containing protein, putative [Leishmania lindenbergi]|uniref:DnaJ domain containing protein n=1 Tax=Leishmania lindenbergi TaxID=651832 RepID=A0AAW3ASJ2_9TRYP
MASGGPFAAAAWCMARRHASTGRRPTFAEIAEALDVLEVSIDVDPKALKRKYRELVKKNHPDAGGEEATMARVTVAYERLSALTNREREEFKLQKTFRGGGGASSAASRRYRPGPPGGFGYAAPNGPFQSQTVNMYGQYYPQDANTAYHQAHSSKGQQGYWNHFHSRSGSGGFANNPFTSNNPFSMYAQAQRARFTSSGSLLIQGLVVYLVLSTIFLFVYRSYRDWRHDDGWRMSESLARHEQMQEIHRIRQEMNERARTMQQRDDDYAAAAPYGGRQYVGESPKDRAFEYARQRRIQMMQERPEAAANLPELRGWPKIGEEKGRIIKRAQDPSGIVFFEPCKADTRRRQVEVRRRNNDFVSCSPSESPPTQLSRAAQGGPPSDAAAATAAISSSLPAHSSVSLPPESNVSSIVMKPVSGEEEAQAVMHRIFGGLRKISS